MLPLDLHVLSLSLAFILSQDQTLRCKFLLLIFSCAHGHPNPISLLTVRFYLYRDNYQSYLLYCCINSFKERFLVDLSRPRSPVSDPLRCGLFLLESGCKSRRFILTMQVLQPLFFILFLHPHAIGLIETHYDTKKNEIHSCYIFPITACRKPLRWASIRIKKS